MMSGVDKESSRDGGSRKILLLGDAHKAFLDADALEEKCFEACATIAEATDAARRNRFAAVAVVISGLPIGLKSALEALRDCCEARIVLLAQMYEEPIAIRLVNCAHNGASLANDYLICPVEPERFYESITAAPEPGPVEPPLPAAVRTSAETRIRDLERLATEDDLTGLKNRRYIREFARQIIERAAQENGRVTLLVFDIDDFKHYNDVVGRIGGDEFAVVFWDDPQRASNSKIDIRKSTMPAGRGRDRRSASADHPKEALFIARRFVGELEKAGLSSFGVLGPGGKGVLTISGGLASFPRDGRTSDELFLLADKALLEAKRSGKNRIYLVGKPQNNIADIK
jgi:GGDEF domain-containing protein